MVQSPLPRIVIEDNIGVLGGLAWQLANGNIRTASTVLGLLLTGAGSRRDGALVDPGHPFMNDASQMVHDHELVVLRKVRLGEETRIETSEAPHRLDLSQVNCCQIYHLAHQLTIARLRERVVGDLLSDTLKLRCTHLVRIGDAKKQDVL